jgi:membrane-bound lytic murein transglycosylase D
MNTRRYRTLLLSILPVALVLTGIQAGADTGMEPDAFPIYDSIRLNISFWKKIYSEYSTTQGVIHDNQNLDIIYDVIALEDRDRFGSEKINRERVNAAKKKYKLILAGLARGEPPVGPDERRVADLFGPNAEPADFQAAMRHLRCQLGQKDPFRQGIIRSGAYLQQIKQIFRESGLPEDLAYLPHVESSFNPQAYSKFGAAGIWQFTRTTGKRYLAVGYAVDERRDPILSSQAAARLLQSNFRKLQNWPMAITAYNHGVSGMLRAQRSKEDYETIFKDYRSRIFRFASRNFYSEFLAAREVARNYQQYFGELELEQPIASQQIVMAGFGSLPEIARQLELDLDVLRKLNPSLRDPVIRGQKFVPRGFGLRLPARPDQDWQIMVAELAPKIYKNNQIQSRIYTVQKGDTAGEIARLHGVNLNDLIAANDLDARGTIYIDFDAVESRPAASSAPIQTASESSQPPETMAVDRSEPQRGSIEPASYPAVVQGNLAVREIRNEHGRPVGTIRVEVEETLGHYAEWLEVSAAEIRRLNGFRYGKPIRINETIKIPMHRVTQAQFEERRFEYHKELAEDFFAAYRIEKVQIYSIKAGDNIWTLSRELFEVPLWLIKKYNDQLDFGALQPAQEIKIPVIVEKNI